jgi:hypothetical protein
MPLARLVLATTLAAVVAGGVPASRPAPAAVTTVASAGVISRLSGPSPYASCGPDAVPGDTVYPNAEVEPDLAGNPAAPANLVAVWQQDRWSAGGAKGLMAGYSVDGGRTWGRTTLPFSVCAPQGAHYDRASDPAVSIGPDGTAYAIGLSFDLSGGRNAITSAVSTDGGRTWTRLREITADTGNGLDKEWITADPRRSGTAYAVWDNLVVAADGHFRGPAYFSVTRDHGSSWSTPIAIAATGQDQQTLGNQILVDPRTGRLYDTYAFYCDCPALPAVAYVTSDDGGQTWSGQHVVSDMVTIGVRQPGTGADVRSGGFPLGAITRTGQVYLTWQDSRFSGGSHDEIAVATTRDHGAHWSAPHRANRPTGRPAFTPAVAVTRSGTVAISYYDFRHDDIHDGFLSTDYWATTTTDGVHFTGDRHLAGPFDLAAAPDARGYFIGDYEGLAASGNTFVAAFAMTNCASSNCPGNRTDIYGTRFAASGASGASGGVRTGVGPRAGDYRTFAGTPPTTRRR